MTNKPIIESDFLLYQTDDGNVNVDVILKDETIWLTQKSMAKLFAKDVKTINRHLINIFHEGELEKNSTISNFEIVQNKLHYAITGYTAAELIYNRIDSNKSNLGLTNWKNSPNGKIMKYDISVAKNYLNEVELKKLERLTISFLDYAEDMAEEQQIMTMQKWIDTTNDLLNFRKKKILNDSGSVSHKQAIDKANKEYEKYRIKQDLEYVSSMDEMYERYLEEERR